MKAYLINPKAKTVTEITISDPNAEHAHMADIYQALKCDLFTTIEINQEGDSIFVDDEGLLKDPSEQEYFVVTGSASSVMLAGNGLVIGMTTDTGDSQDPTISLEDLTKMITWPDKAWAEKKR